MDHLLRRVGLVPTLSKIKAYQHCKEISKWISRNSEAAYHALNVASNVTSSSASLNRPELVPCSVVDWSNGKSYIPRGYTRECTGQEDPRNHMENHDLRHEVACTHEF